MRTCNALLSSLVSFGELGGATRVLEAMDGGAASKANGFTLCMMMRAHGQRRQFAEAEALWERLNQRRWVDTVALNTWLQVCMGCGQQRRALPVHPWRNASSERIPSGPGSPPAAPDYRGPNQ